jgi:VIT1/CCC1 family predicted Fe2+/Mn2+ transporter
MTFVEAGLLLALAGLVGGLLTRRKPFGRALWMVSAVILVALLAKFGSEFAADLF